jgi:hypothetical protein
MQRKLFITNAVIFRGWKRPRNRGKFPPISGKEEEVGMFRHIYCKIGKLSTTNGAPLLSPSTLPFLFPIKLFLFNPRGS